MPIESAGRRISGIKLIGLAALCLLAFVEVAVAENRDWVGAISFGSGSRGYPTAVATLVGPGMTFVRIPLDVEMSLYHSLGGEGRTLLGLIFAGHVEMILGPSLEVGQRQIGIGLRRGLWSSSNQGVFLDLTAGIAHLLIRNGGPESTVSWGPGFSGSVGFAFSGFSSWSPFVKLSGGLRRYSTSDYSNFTLFVGAHL